MRHVEVDAPVGVVKVGRERARRRERPQQRRAAARDVEREQRVRVAQRAHEQPAAVHVAARRWYRLNGARRVARAARVPPPRCAALNAPSMYPPSDASSSLQNPPPRARAATAVRPGALGVRARSVSPPPALRRRRRCAPRGFLASSSVDDAPAEGFFVWSSSSTTRRPTKASSSSSSPVVFSSASSATSRRRRRRPSRRPTSRTKYPICCAAPCSAGLSAGRVLAEVGSEVGERAPRAAAAVGARRPEVERVAVQEVGPDVLAVELEPVRAERALEVAVALDEHALGARRVGHDAALVREVHAARLAATGVSVWPSLSAASRACPCRRSAQSCHMSGGRRDEAGRRRSAGRRAPAA